jgi:hypothetical protein
VRSVFSKSAKRNFISPWQALLFLTRRERNFYCFGEQKNDTVAASFNRTDGLNLTSVSRLTPRTISHS